jgi:energy-coupling factor transporter ATP-binding protein EcfA2
MIKTQILEAIKQMPNSDTLEVIELHRLSNKKQRFAIASLICVKTQVLGSIKPTEFIGTNLCQMAV